MALRRAPNALRAECGPSTARGRPLSELSLLDEPLVEHVAREANVPTHSMAGQAISPHGLIDPAWLDVQIPGGLLWAPEPILRQHGRWVCRRCCFHARYRPPRGSSGQRIQRELVPRRSVPSPWREFVQTARQDPPRPRSGPLGKSVGKSAASSARPAMLLFGRRSVGWGVQVSRGTGSPWALSVSVR